MNQLAYQFITCLKVNEATALDTIKLSLLDSKRYKADIPYSTIEHYHFPYWESYLELNKN